MENINNLYKKIYDYVDFNKLGVTDAIAAFNNDPNFQNDINDFVLALNNISDDTILFDTFRNLFKDMSLYSIERIIFIVFCHADNLGLKSRIISIQPDTQQSPNNISAQTHIPSKKTSNNIKMFKLTQQNITNLFTLYSPILFNSDVCLMDDIIDSVDYKFSEKPYLENEKLTMTEIYKDNMFWENIYQFINTCEDELNIGSSIIALEWTAYSNYPFYDKYSEYRKDAKSMTAQNLIVKYGSDMVNAIADVDFRVSLWHKFIDEFKSILDHVGTIVDLEYDDEDEYYNNLSNFKVI